MKKNLGLLGMALLSLVLVACSFFEREKTASSSTSSSLMMQASTSTQSSLSASMGFKESTVVYLSDEDIDSIQTFGDYKQAFNLLRESYLRDFDNLMAQLPDKTQSALESYRTHAVENLAQQQEGLTIQFANIGDDSTPIPEEGKEILVTILKQVREGLKQHIQGTRDKAQTLLNP